MSLNITVQSMIDDAASEFGDPAKSRYGESDWLRFYNRSLEEVTREFGVLEQDASFSWTIDEDRYTYPDDLSQMTRLRYSETPPNDWQDVDELFDDEFQNRTNYSLPTGTGYLCGYWARPSFFQVTPRPTVSIAQGGLLTYWRLAARVSSVTTGVLFELPDSCRLLCIDRMVIAAQMQIGRTSEAKDRLVVWRAQMEEIAPRLTDKSEDRRTAFRPKLSLGASEAQQ